MFGMIGTAKSAGLEEKLLLPGGKTASYRLGSFSSKAKESIPLQTWTDQLDSDSVRYELTKDSEHTAEHLGLRE